MAMITANETSAPNRIVIVVRMGALLQTFVVNRANSNSIRVGVVQEIQWAFHIGGAFASSQTLDGDRSDMSAMLFSRNRCIAEA